MVCYPNFWGSGIVASNLWLELSKRWHDIHFISYKKPVRLENIYSDTIHYHHVDIYNYPLFEYPLYESALVSAIVNIVKKEELDILHVHYAIPHASAAYMAKTILQDEWIYLPFVTTLHGTDISLVGKDKVFKPTITFALNHADAITSVSHSLKNDTYKYFDVTKDIITIPNFIDAQEYSFSSSFKRSNFAKENERLLIHVSNFRPVKMIPDVIKIFDVVQKKLPAQLIMIGDGPHRLAAEKLCKKLNIQDRVHFLGLQTNPKEYMQISDLLLLPSQSEQCSLSLLEGFACKVPAVTTNTWWTPELNIHGYSWYVADMGDVLSMAQYALDILQDEWILALFKTQAYKQSDKFLSQNIIPLYEKIYTDLLSNQVP